MRKQTQFCSVNQCLLRGKCLKEMCFHHLPYWTVTRLADFTRDADPMKYKSLGILFCVWWQVIVSRQVVSEVTLTTKLCCSKYFERCRWIQKKNKILLNFSVKFELDPKWRKRLFHYYDAVTCTTANTSRDSEMNLEIKEFNELKPV